MAHNVCMAHCHSTYNYKGCDIFAQQITLQFFNFPLIYVLSLNRAYVDKSKSSFNNFISRESSHHTPNNIPKNIKPEWKKIMQI